MHVLVTGATGFLGSHIVQELLCAGHTVRAAVRTSSDISFLKGQPNTECFPVDLHDHQSILPSLDAVDAVIHAAGGGKIKRTTDFYYQNTHLTEELIQAIRKTAQGPKKLILVSSIAAAGPSRKPLPRSEADPPRPVSHYGRSKLEAEAVCLGAQNEIHTTIIRPPVIYGPRDTKMLAVFKGIQKGLLLKPPGKSMSIVYGPDCARAICLALNGNQKSGSIYYVDDGEAHTWIEFGRAIRDALSTSKKRKRLLSVKIPSGLIYWSGALNEIRARVTGRPAVVTRDKWRDGKQPYWLCSSKRIREELGFLPRTLLQDGIPLTVNWYKSQGWL